MSRAQALNFKENKFGADSEYVFNCTLQTAHISFIVSYLLVLPFARVVVHILQYVGSGSYGCLGTNCK